MEQVLRGAKVVDGTGGPRIVLANDDEEELARRLGDDRAVLGLSDAGAHASQLCDACFSTPLLEHWVRDTGVLTLEQAV
jgi:N-acyl-D-amino-acid deacylase